ncbi:MAG: DUF6036 family nucleotidyltransferase [Actinomycetota bacterium]|nr:hypothetical protein [Actinomycetota bacterium]
MSLYEDLFEALNRARVRYIVVGGIAVVLHGHARLTADVDLVIDLDPAEALRAIDALTDLGLLPRTPVDPHAFADAEIRDEWIRTKNMQVFSLIDPTNPLRVVDIFVEYPMPFEQLWARSTVMRFGQEPIRVVGIDDLMAMKEAAGRAQDRADVDALRKIMKIKPEDTVSEWPVTYEANEDAQRLEVARMTPEQRLRWVENNLDVGADGAMRRKAQQEG